MIFQYLDDFIDSYSVPRSKGNISISEPILIFVFYLITIKKLGPWFMEKRKPFNIKNIVMAFDAIQVAINFYFVIEITREISRMPGKFYCLEVDTSDSPHSEKSFYLTKFYYWLKLSDLLDTIFFVLKKNWRQVSFLHVYHHGTMIIISWIGLKLAPGGHCAYFGLANTIVHTFMYSYYFLTAYDPSWKVVSLKKFITQIQLVQFIFIFTTFFPTLLLPCSLSPIVALAATSQSVYFFYLFGQFYYNTYIKPNSPGQRNQRVHSNNN